MRYSEPRDCGDRLLVASPFKEPTSAECDHEDEAHRTQAQAAVVMAQIRFRIPQKFVPFRGLTASR